MQIIFTLKSISNIYYEKNTKCIECNLLYGCGNKDRASGIQNMNNVPSLTCPRDLPNEYHRDRASICARCFATIPINYAKYEYQLGTDDDDDDDEDTNDNDTEYKSNKNKKKSKNYRNNRRIEPKGVSDYTTKESEYSVR